MTRELYLDIVSPEKSLFSGRVECVRLPGSLGAFTILPQHAPIISSLVTGTVSYVTDGIEHAIDIHSGFVEMNDNKVSVCVE